MISFPKVVHMVVSLRCTFIGLAGIYVLLDAEFVAFVQVLIYAGAISILMIFGIMMTKHQSNEEGEPRVRCMKGYGDRCFGVVRHFVLRDSSIGFSCTPGSRLMLAKIIQWKSASCFLTASIPFEIISVLLTVAFIGAIVLAKKEE